MARDFPEISRLIVYENDGSFWLCHPDQCERCRASLRKQKPPYDAFSWELTSSFISLLQDAVRPIRPDFQVIGATYHYLNAMDAYIENLHPGAGVVTPSHNADAWIYIPVTKEMQDGLRRWAGRADAKGVSFMVIDEITHSEKLGFAPACPWPHATWQKLRAYADCGVQIWSLAPIPSAQGINPIVLKEFLWGSDEDKDALFRRVASAQFGEAAGRKMLSAWDEVRQCFETLFQPANSWWYNTYLMTGNLATQFGMFRPLTIEGLKAKPDQYFSGSGDPNSRAHFIQAARNRKSLGQLKTAVEHLRKAVACAKEAVRLAPTDRRPFYSFYFFPRRNLTCRQYAEEQYHSLNFNRFIFESNANFIEAELLVREGKEAEAQAVIDRENAMTEELLRTSAACLANEIGLLHDCAARVTPYEVLGEQHPVIERLSRKLVADHTKPVRKLVVPKGEGAILPDGVLHEPAWRKAAMTRAAFILLGSRTRPAQAQTTVRACRDAENLYVAFECREPNMDGLVAKQWGRDGPVYDDDCVNLFLSPRREEAPFHFIVNATGSVYDEKGSDAAWDGGWETGAAQSDMGWIVEMRIPFATLGRVPKDGEVWFCNFNRERKAGRRELSSWSPTVAVFAEPERFGELVFH